VKKASFFLSTSGQEALVVLSCVQKCVMSHAHILNMNQGAGLRTNTSITELDVSWNDINYTNYNSIELMVQTQANIYQQV
jgi:predicted transcriptional regulator